MQVHDAAHDTSSTAGLNVPPAAFTSKAAYESGNAGGKAGGHPHRALTLTLPGGGGNPTLSSVSVSSVTATSASLAATSTKAGFIYYSVLPAAADTPSADAVMTTGSGTSTEATADSAVTISLKTSAGGCLLAAHTAFKVRSGRVLSLLSYMCGECWPLFVCF